VSSFLDQNWKWIVGSILVVIVAIVVILVFAGTGWLDLSPFQYSEF
jgi:hypothetical protein